MLHKGNRKALRNIKRVDPVIKQDIEWRLINAR